MLDEKYVAAIATMQEQIRGLVDGVKDTRDAVREIQRTLNNPEGSFITRAEFDPVKQRVDKLSSWRHWVMGGLAATGFLVGSGVTLWKMLGHG